MNKLIILKPYVTEKTTTMNNQNKFVFISLVNHSKIEYKTFFKTTFDVNVKDVNILKKPSKPKRRGKINYKTTTKYKVVITLLDDKNKEKITEQF